MANGVESTPDEPRMTVPEWKKIVARYEVPSFWRASWQVVNTLGSYVLLWYLMYRVKAFSLWLTLPLAALAGALLVRVFIIFHDCGHGSFFKSRRANTITGFIAGLLTMTPYYYSDTDHLNTDESAHAAA
ncbi:MAG: fatty acid desaturase, partial [Phycisphaerae bacterium]